MIAQTRVETIGRCLPPEFGKFCTLFYNHGAGAGESARQAVAKRYGKVRNSLFTFLEHPDAPPDNNGSERELRPTATYRKVTGGFRSTWGADLFAAVRSVVGTAARRGCYAYQAISHCPGMGNCHSTGLSS